MDELVDKNLYFNTVVFCIGLIDDITQLETDECWRCEDSVLRCICINEDVNLLARSMRHGLN